jgi:high-affinity Fe2+/Pb2+ permease
MMCRYEKVSGAFFGLLAAVQLTRLLFRWPVQVASVSVPLWASALAILITAVLATWAFRTASRLPPRSGLATPADKR